MLTHSIKSTSLTDCIGSGVSHSFGMQAQRNGNLEPIEANLLTHFGTSLPHKICNENNFILVEHAQNSKSLM